MPRRRVASKQPWIPDPIYQDDQITQFMNIVMRDGKKAVAEGIVYGALRTVEDRTKDEPLKLFKRAVENCQPMVEVKSRRVGGANYQVPWKFVPNAAFLWLCAGSCSTRVNALGVPWWKSWPTRSWRPPITVETPSRSATTCIVWQMPTRRSHTIVGSSFHFPLGVVFSPS